MRTSIELLRARISIADGESLTVCERLKPIVVRRRAAGRQCRLCEALLQLAAAEDLRGDEKACNAALAEALEIGSTEGYSRSFVDEGSSIRSLIVRWLKTGASSNRPAIKLATELVGPTEKGLQRSPKDGVCSVTISKRERQIIGLLNEGLSNAQLAKRCFITEGTVKWYLHNLYEKLDVGNRTALLRAAREQGIAL